MSVVLTRALVCCVAVAVTACAFEEPGDEAAPSAGGVPAVTARSREVAPAAYALQQPPDRCLALRHHPRLGFDAVVESRCDDSRSQGFRLTATDDGGYRVAAVDSDLCLDASLAWLGVALVQPCRDGDR